MVTCTFENGNQAKLRHVVVHALAIKDNKILLVKRAPHLTNPNKYGFPGGYLDLNETIEQGVLRELKEETGYAGKVIKLISIVDKPDRKGEDRQNIGLSYEIEVLEKSGDPDSESSEITWFDLDNLPIEEDFAFDHFEILTSYLQSRSDK